MGKSAGKVMPRPRGAYDKSETYKILDMVTLDNKLWIAKQSGITGITPSKTATEWMMAVDGTTDVKALETEIDAKFASIDEQFLAKDTQISGIDERVTAAESDISALESRFVFDSTPKKDSTKLMTSGGIYDITHQSMRLDLGSTVLSYDHKTRLDGQSLMLIGSQDSYSEQIDGSIDHHIDTATMNVSSGNLNFQQERSLGSDNTHTQITHSTRMSFSGGDAYLELMNSDIRSSAIKLQFRPNMLRCWADSFYDLGQSNYKFKDIYASSGTIQTSDITEKKDIVDLGSEITKSIVMGLRPVTFKFIDGTSDRTHYGLIAQEVEELVNGLGITNKDFAPLIKSPKEDTDGNIIEGEYVYGLRYSELTGLLVKMCQNLQNEVDDLKARLGGA